MAENPQDPKIPLPPFAPPTPLIGSSISHYRILERLGGGGMGVVYKGWDLRLERYAAVKFLSPHRSNSEDFKRRFTREARTASRLEHPNICTVFETDETDDGRLFIAMAFCEGESLKRKIERGPLPLPQALSIAAQVASGLAAAHDKGVVHRDVKPANVMVADDGRVKIVDFGIARLADETRLTRTGDVMGTTAYISPEQFLSAETDHRTDLWSLGVVLYEMLTGRLPWVNGDERELINAIVKRQPRPISALRPGMPQALERVVARALAKRPADRYQRADELHADLLAVAELVSDRAPIGPYEQTVVDAPSPGPERQVPPPSALAGPLAAAAEDGGAGAPAGTGAAGASSAPASRASAAPESDRADVAQSSAVPAEQRGPRATAGTAAAGAAGGAGAAPPSGDGDFAGTAGAADSAGGAGSAASERRPGTGMIGRVFAHYRILGPLGGGGMGVVYKAQDLSLERVVALKFLPPELSRDPEAKTRFLQEARAASALDHPNICTIHEVGETDEAQLYLAMACYDGETLKQRLRHGPLPIDEALDAAQQIARGLVKAHRNGIVHRDIKPANLMITTDEIVKILDFGIAKLAGAAGLTRIGSSLGTPGYMSPEQARGEEVDPRTDVWSLGAVLYEMVTGRRPFRGEHDQAVLYALFNQEPEPVAQLRPEAPPELVRIIGRMLAKDPDQRYLTAAEALADLRALYGPVTGTGTRTGMTGAMTGTTSVPALPMAPAPARRWPLAALIAAAVLGAILAAYLVLRAGPAASPIHSRQVQYQSLTEDEGRETFPSIQPNGDLFVYAKSVDGRSHIFLQRVGDTNVLKDLSQGSTSDDTQPAFSPDGQHIAFRSERNGGGIFVMGPTGELVHQVTPVGYNPAWSPDSKEVVIATQSVANPVKHSGTASKLYRVKIDGGGSRLISAGDALQPAWSPNGARIAYWGVPPGSGKRVISTIPAGGGEPVRVVDDEHLNWSPAWLPGGKFLYYSSNRGGLQNLWRVPIDEVSGRALGDPEEVTTPSSSSGLMSFSADGRRMIYASNETRSNLERLRIDDQSQAPAGQREPIASGLHEVITASVSPDGRWIAYHTSGQHEDIFRLQSDGTARRRLTEDSSRNRRPVWAADSARILFYSNRNANRANKYEAWEIRPDGNLEQLTAVPIEAVYDPVGSPAGTLLACNLEKSGAAFFNLELPLAKRLPQVLPKTPAGNTFNVESWSPDAKRLSGFDSQGRIVLYTIATRTYQELDIHGTHTVWLHDNRRLLYGTGGGVCLLDSARSTGNAVRTLLNPTASSTFMAIGSSPDDQLIYLLSFTEEGHIYLRTSG
jgi:serine/threonine protein kinase/Tol biopolymer transport system component